MQGASISLWALAEAPESHLLCQIRSQACFSLSLCRGTVEQVLVHFNFTFMDESPGLSVRVLSWKLDWLDFYTILMQKCIWQRCSCSVEDVNPLLVSGIESTCPRMKNSREQEQGV